MKIVFFSDSPHTISGFGTVSRNLATYLQSVGHDVHYIGWQTFGQQMVASFHDKILGFKLYPNVGGQKFGEAAWKYWLPRIEPDLFFTLADFWMLLDLFKQNEIPYPWLMYYPIDGYPITDQMTEMLKKLDYRVAMSHYGADMVKSIGMETGCITHGVETSNFKPLHPNIVRQMKQRLGIPSNAFVVGRVDRNQKRKMVPRTIKSFLPFKKDYPDSVLLLWMDRRDPEGWDLEFVCKRFGLEIGKDVFFPPPDMMANFMYGVSEEELAQVMNCIDIHCFLTGGEGFGLSQLETMSCGVVNVCTDYTCHDDQTKAWMEDGFKNPDEIKIGDMAWVLKNGKLVLEPVLDVLIWDYEGFMYKIKNNSVNLNVTPEHRVYYKYRKGRKREIIKDWNIKTAEEIYDSKLPYIYLPVTGGWDGDPREQIKTSELVSQEDLHGNSNKLPEILKVKTLLTLLGWYISEGYLQKDKITKYNKIVFCNSSSSNKLKIKEAIEDLGLHCGEEDSFVYCYCVPLARLFQTAGMGAENKKIPKWALQFSRKSLMFLYNAMMMRDGSKLGEDHYIVYTTSSKQLQKDFAKLVLKIGYSPRLTEWWGGGNRIGDRQIKRGVHYTVYVRTQCKGFIRRKQIKKQLYEGIVWCLSTPSNNFFVLRENLITNSGNTCQEIQGDWKCGLPVKVETFEVGNAGVDRALADVEDAYEKMKWLRENPDEMKVRSNNGVKRAREIYDWSHIVRQFDEWIRDNV